MAECVFCFALRTLENFTRHVILFAMPAVTAHDEWHSVCVWCIEGICGVLRAGVCVSSTIGKS